GIDVVLNEVGFNGALQAATDLNHKHGEGDNQPLAVTKHCAYIFKNAGSTSALSASGLVRDAILFWADILFWANILFWIVPLPGPGKTTKKSQYPDHSE